MKRRILFLTGTRADYGKMKPLIKAVDEHPDFDCTVFATGMHTLSIYGNTVLEVMAAGFKDVHVFMNQFINEPMEMALANTVSGLSRFVHERSPDMIVVHGDRVEAMAGAIVGALRNILVGHVEGGELSGTVDELIRHSVSKLSHLHFVANVEAASRLQQMGERQSSIYVIGSPDIDVMLSNELPSLDRVKAHYEITFERFALALFHPVTTEIAQMRDHARNFVDALIASERNYVVVYPNNDEGTQYILDEYKRLVGNSRFRIFPSIKFESFLTLLKKADFVIGNSSAGIREAPFYGKPTVNIGSRQSNRFFHTSIVNADYDVSAILDGVTRAGQLASTPSNHFGSGDSSRLFMEALCTPSLWQVPTQKQFKDLPSMPAHA